MVDEFTAKEVDSKIIDILYFDWTYIDEKGNEQDNNAEIGPNSFKKTVHLKEYITGTDLKKEVAEYLEQNVSEIDVFKNIYSENNIITDDFKQKVKRKMTASSFLLPPTVELDRRQIL